VPRGRETEARRGDLALSARGAAGPQYGQGASFFSPRPFSGEERLRFLLILETYNNPSAAEATPPSAVGVAGKSLYGSRQGRAALHHGDGWGPAALLPLRLLLLRELVRGALRAAPALPERAAAAPGLCPRECLLLAFRRNARAEEGPSSPKSFALPASRSGC
jgi:hypothetical protein